jgi:hypothetical protein
MGSSKWCHLRTIQGRSSVPPGLLWSIFSSQNRVWLNTYSLRILRKLTRLSRVTYTLRPLRSQGNPSRGLELGSAIAASGFTPLITESDSLRHNRNHVDRDFTLCHRHRHIALQIIVIACCQRSFFVVVLCGAARRAAVFLRRVCPKQLAYSIAYVNKELELIMEEGRGLRDGANRTKKELTVKRNEH